jgi:hypothetical protein
MRAARSGSIIRRNLVHPFREGRMIVLSVAHNRGVIYRLEHGRERLATGRSEQVIEYLRKTGINDPERYIKLAMLVGKIEIDEPEPGPVTKQRSFRL